ncbi:MAG: type II toxin-antitoxin system RelE/ParE family toxin [Candidatus Binatia bacterium]
MIKSFRDKDTEALAHRKRVAKFHSFERAAQRKLRELDIATSLGDLAAIPGNRLEALKGDRKGQHSIRINDQFRICFIWKGGDAHDVEVADYH